MCIKREVVFRVRVKEYLKQSNPKPTPNPYTTSLREITRFLYCRVEIGIAEEPHVENRLTWRRSANHFSNKKIVSSVRKTGSVGYALCLLDTDCSSTIVVPAILLGVVWKDTPYISSNSIDML